MRSGRESSVTGAVFFFFFFFLKRKEEVESYFDGKRRKSSMERNAAFCFFSLSRRTGLPHSGQEPAAGAAETVPGPLLARSSTASLSPLAKERERKR